MAKYRIKRGPLGRSVQYECERCGVPLTSKLGDAGSQDSCPECGHAFIVPGEEERKKKPLPKPKSEGAAKLAQSQADKPPAASPTSDGAEFADAVEELLGTAQPSEKNAAESPPPPPPPPPPRTAGSPPPSPNPPKTKVRPIGQRPFSERVLDRAFRIAKMFSVATILVLAALIVLSLSASGLILLRLRAVEAPQVVLPTIAEVRTFLSERETARAEYGLGAESRSPAAGLSPLEELQREFSLGEFTMMVLDRISDDLSRDEERRLLSGLHDLLPRVPAESRNDAIIYYCERFRDARDAYKEDIDSDVVNNAGTYALSITFLTATLYFFFALMAFIAFPLLIKIERNTKLLAEAA